MCEDQVWRLRSCTKQPLLVEPVLVSLVQGQHGCAGVPGHQCLIPLLHHLHPAPPRHAPPCDGAVPGPPTSSRRLPCSSHSSCWGKYLEASAKGKTSEAIGALLNLTPPTAILLEEGSAEEGKAAGKIEIEKEVPTTLIHRGDMLKVSQMHFCSLRWAPLDIHSGVAC